MAEQERIPVSRLADYLTRIVRGLEPLQRLAVVGELSNVKQYRSGHVYFSIKDREAAMSCVLFRSQAEQVSFRLEDGQQVVLYCRCDFYGRQGQLQLIVDRVELEGTGRLYEAFDRLKRQLEAEGLFAPELKRPLPFLPQVIGVVTSPSGAVIRDIIHVLRRRNPHFQLLLAPATVQGPTAAPTLVRALDLLNRDGRAEVIIFGRGGGSIEDLWPFNEEIVARAVAASKIPVVSAVGHETDVTISDFVADLRAPTPSAAAELVMPDRRELVARVSRSRTRMERSLLRQYEHADARLRRLLASPYLSDPLASLRRERERLERAAGAWPLLHPQSMLDRPLQRLDGQQRRLLHAGSQTVNRAATRLARLAAALDALSPLAVLGRGYQLTYNSEGRPLARAAEVKPGERLELHFVDGRVAATAREVRPAAAEGVQI
ncbi:MAG: exodeoxyribonuclease VII large subunit [Bacillota bacterium]|nr:exodeoxyribonuclease VII large subunit [Bacillota bacterium]